MSVTSIPIRVLIADDHEIFREGFNVMSKKQPDLELAGEAENGEELIELTAKLQPDVIVTDIKMPKMDGIEATRILAKSYPHIPVIALSMFDDEELIVDMLEAGARGYLLKNAHKTEIVDAIRTVYNKETYFCIHTSRKLAQMIAKSRFNPYKQKEVPNFTEGETGIIKLICDGLSNKEIAVAQRVSIRTVEKYRERIVEKTGVRNTVGLVVFAIRSGIYKL